MLKVCESTLTYTFQVYKLAEQDRDMLAADDNLFSIIMLTAYDALQRPQKDEQKLQIKMALARTLMARGYPSQAVRDIFLFIKHYTKFAESQYLRTFDRELETIVDHKTAHNMGMDDYIISAYREAGFGEYIDIVMEKGREKGIEKGLQEGIQKGIEKGREEGIEKGREEGIEKGITLKEQEVTLNLWNLQVFPLSQIALVTGTSEGEVIAILTAFLEKQGKTGEEAASLLTAYRERFPDKPNSEN